MSEWFRKETYLKAYQFLVDLVRGRTFWPISQKGPLLPPMVENTWSACQEKKKRTIGN